MLDFSKLMPQLERIEAPTPDDRIEKALQEAGELLELAGKDETGFNNKLAASAGAAFWPLPTALEPIGAVFQIERSPDPVTIVAVDGSQITPSQHEVFNCYLLNVGRVVLSYGSTAPVVLDSAPHLFHAVEDLYPLIDKRRMYVDETFIALERSLLELATLRDLAIEAQKRSLPVVALFDGSLIPWSLDRMPDAYQLSYLKRTNALYRSFLSCKIPLVGYISHSRASEVVNALRVWRCPYEVSRCAVYCGQLCEEDYPCSSIWPLMDRQLFAATPARNTRSPIFMSGNPKAAACDPPHHLTFTYCHTGQEVARLEMPVWLARDKGLLNLALAAVSSQAEKGNGYPISLAEAHNQAVITGSDRAQFFQLLQRSLQQTGVQNVRVSPKESGKRRGIV